MAADDADPSRPGPPPPLPKRLNAVLRLFDAPVHRDWMFWWTVAWAAIACVSILSSTTPSPIPVWLNTLLAVIFFIIALGIVPAWIRLAIRRYRWRQQQAHQASPPSSQAPSPTKTGAPSPRRTASAGPRPRRSAGDRPQGSRSDALGEAPTGLGVTAADPTLVGIDTHASPLPPTRSSVPSHVRWDRINADEFERLLVQLLEQSVSYGRITRPMHVNAADAGRDIQAYRHVDDGLMSDRYERVIVQAKHWPKRGIPPSEIADLVHAKLPLWDESEPIRGLIVATTGAFTQDAVRWVDNHNRAAKRPDIVLWSSNELETLLRKWPEVAADFGLAE